MINPNGFSETFEANEFVVWFREQGFQKGTQLPSLKEIMEEQGITRRTLDQGISYLWGATGELNWEGNSYFIEEKVKYVPKEGWYLEEKLLKKY